MLLSYISLLLAFDTRLISQTTFGSKSLCEIEVPSSYDHISGGVIAAIVVSCLICVALSLAAIIITAIVRYTKNSRRKVCQNQPYASGSVRYNPQTEGEGVVYMIPVSGIPPQGVLLVPPQVGVVCTCITIYCVYNHVSYKLYDT